MANRSPESFIYFFAEGRADAGNDLKPLVGGKGASLAEMTKAGLNVPPGFTISADCCGRFHESGQQWPPGLEDQVRIALARLEQVTGRTFGRGGEPLLVAVRSGAAQSMPGMMDTVLNVGLNPECVRAMAQRTGNARAAWEAYRYFLVMFGHTVGGVDEAVFLQRLADLLKESGKAAEQDLNAGELEELCRRFLETYRARSGREMPSDPWTMLREAIDAVFGSWHNERAVAYRQHHRVEGLVGTAVNVQAMCPSEVSGVLFTANPIDPALPQILIDSSYGLGEAVVLGKVTPDHFVLDKNTLQIVTRSIGDKQHVIATLAHDGRSQTGARDEASLADEQLVELARLGLRVEAYFGGPSDIEWALSAGRFYLLQARPIKMAPIVAATGQPAPSGEEVETVRQQEMAALAARAEPGGTVWSHFNLSEVLPQPTPMTWAIVQRFMSGRGGFGLMYRDLGFDPDPSLDEEGAFDLVCGRPYCNLSREARLHFRQLPFEHSFAALKADPRKALYPQPGLNAARAGWRFWLFLPVLLPAVIVKMMRAETRRQGLMKTFAQRFRTELVPAFSAEADRALAEDLSGLETPALLERLEFWTQRALHDFARDSLKPTALAAFALGNLEQKLVRQLGAERAQPVVRELAMRVHPDPEADLPTAVRDLSAGRLERAVFLQRFGHRGSHEMELSQPRWSEDPAALDRLASKKPAGTSPGNAANPVAPSPSTPLPSSVTSAEVELLRTYLGLRETAKHYLMKGFAVLRRILVELDRRFELNGGIFYLTPVDLPRLVAGEDLSATIDAARRRRVAALSLELPQVLFSDDLEALGRRTETTSTASFQGVPLSAGVAEAPALVLSEPGMEAPPTESYILVCPSTDPAWVPLFVNACGLVMETGGVLSHGAIVARDFGLPAVAGLPGVQKQLRTGQRLRVDGGTGLVTVLG